MLLPLIRLLPCSLPLLLSATGFATAAAAPADRPNIVYIMADDHGRQAVSCYGSKLIKTPQIDRLAGQGIRFEQAMATNSICSPSRAVLITGKYNHLAGVRLLDGHFDRSQQTFPRLLQQAGYQTALVGKWHLFTEPAGFDYFSVLPGHGRYIDCPFKETGQPWGDNGNKGGIVRPGYVTDVITDLSLDWLKRRDASRPFCLMIHHKAPHSPHVPAERHKDLFKDTVFPEPANLLDTYAGRAPEKVADALAWSRLVQQPEAQYQAIRKAFTDDRDRDTRSIFQEYVRNYLRLVAALDENVGRVLDYLDQSGLAKNTVVIYTSDNGYFLGEHGFYNKMWMYEEGFHLPLIIRLPEGMKAATPGTVSQELVSMLDMAPTILDLAGVRVPPDMQGQSMRPLLAGDKTEWRQEFYYHYYGVVGPPRPGNFIAHHEIVGIRSRDSKLICYPTWKGGPFWEFFDLVKDPQEMQNLYADPGRAPEIARARQRLAALAERYQDAEMVKFFGQQKPNAP